MRLRAARVSWIVALCAACACAPAQSGLAALQRREAETFERGVVALQQAVGDAARDTLALVVASHPDDRWVMPAAWFRFKLNWRVTALVLTRGEGGQNSSGPETGDDLGAIRTLETEISARRLDTRVVHLNRPDTGFCKTGTEALDAWGVRGTVGDMARLLRRIRPDVVVTTHHPQETHGHDLALLQLLPEAIELAANEAFVTPGFEPLPRPRSFRGAGVDEVAHEVLDMDEVDALRGDTYRRLAYAALGEHRSQLPLQPIDELFAHTLELVPIFAAATNHDGLAGRLVESLPSLRDVAANDADFRALVDELETGLSPLLGRRPLLLQKALDLRARLAVIAPKLRGDSAIRVARRLEALERVVFHGSGLRLGLEPVDDDIAIPGETLRLRMTARNGPYVDFDDVRLEARAGGTLDWPTGNGSAALERRKTIDQVTELRVGADVPDRTRWVEQMFRQDQWQPPIQLVAVLRLGGQEIERPLPLPVEVLSAVELRSTPRSLLLPRGSDEVRFTVSIRRNSRSPVQSVLEVLAPPGFVVHGAPRQVAMDHETSQIVELSVRVPVGQKAGVSSIQVRCAGQRLTLPLHKVDVEVARGLRVGLVKGVDDSAESTLRGLGVHLVVLGDDDLAIRPLDDLDTIVCDIRSLLRQAAREAFPRFLRFVESGGRLVVLYHKDVEFNLDTAGFRGAPFELRIGKSRVTHEDAPVSVLQPTHPLMTTPNAIHAKDWDGWVQERGLYFPERRRASDGYTELIATSDPGEPAERGALLQTNYGRGDYVYCALALHRQLKTLHPGACRLFANLVSRPRAQ